MSKKCLLRIVLGLFLAALLDGSALATEQPSVPRVQPKPDAVIAVVNGEPITEAMLQAYASIREWEVGDVSSPAVRKRLINELIDEALLFQEAQRLGLKDDPQVATRLELGRRETLATAVVREFLKERGPGETAIRKEYEKMAPALSPRSYHVRGIVMFTLAYPPQEQAD